MEKLVCFINLFTSNARVYIVHEDTNEQTLVGEIPVDTLEEKLATYSHVTNINNIVLIGAPVFAQELVPEIIQYAKIQYNNNDLLVEVMK